MLAVSMQYWSVTDGQSCNINRAYRASASTRVSIAVLTREKKLLLVICSH